MKKNSNRWLPSLILVIMSGLLLPHMLRNGRILQEGVTTQATVIERWRSSDKKGSTTYMARYVFPVGESGATATGQTRLGRDAYEAMNLPERGSAGMNVFNQPFPTTPTDVRQRIKSFSLSPTPSPSSQDQLAIVYVRSNPSISEMASISTPMLLSPFFFFAVMLVLLVRVARSLR